MRKGYPVLLCLLFALLQVQAQAASKEISGAHRTSNTRIDTVLIINEVELAPIDDDPGEAISDLPEVKVPEEEFPAHAMYHNIWTGEKINPYNIRLVDTPDTVAIDLSGYCHPVHNVVTSNFGFRRWRHHYGIDLRLKRGDSVRCAFDGMVRIARRSSSYGYYVVVRHYNGLETVYGHFSKLLVKPNQKVHAGELLGWGGSTGRSSGPHLHYELRYLGTPIDPNAIIDFAGYAPHSDTLLLCASHFDYIKEIEKIRTWTVRKGDTLGGIAQRTGVSVATLCRLNNISKASILHIGQKIRYT
jgi:murein DD-endopeptidase MepM/ murein hydrolase activator NlpD